jgi:hypothetical protein
VVGQDLVKNGGEGWPILVDAGSLGAMTAIDLQCRCARRLRCAQGPVPRLSAI